MTNPTAKIEQVLVIGATGKSGRRVYQQLCELLPPAKVKAAGRLSESYFDWENRQSWSLALQGISHVYLNYFPDLAVPKAASDIQAFCDLANQQKVKHITLLSGRGEPAAKTCEDILINSGLSWTIVRASWFNQNFSDGFFKTFIELGQINLPVDSVKEPFIDVDDIAEIVTQSIIDTRHKNTLYEVTGPELLTFNDIADQLTDVLDKAVTFSFITPTEFSASMSAINVPEEVISMLNFLFTEVLDGRNQYITNGVEQALGRKPKSFKAFVESNMEQLNQ
jgi:uncharacterized protein YbjT (DUF2867 family)